MNDKRDVAPTTNDDDLSGVTLMQARFITALDSNPAPRPGPPRIIISLDCTSSMGEYLPSRKLDLYAIRRIVRPMFEQAGAAGLEVQFVYFRGDDEHSSRPRVCQASMWFTDPEELTRAMAAVEHAPGWTQHNRVFKHVIKEAEKRPVHELVIITDAYEGPAGRQDLAIVEAPRSRRLRRPHGDVLEEGCIDAMRLRRLGVKITVAYKGTIRHGCPLDRAGVGAEQAFQEITEDNNGSVFLYDPADPDMVERFREVAAHAERMAKADMAGAQVLLEHMQSVPFEMDPVKDVEPISKCETA